MKIVCPSPRFTITSVLAVAVLVACSGSTPDQGQSQAQGPDPQAGGSPSAAGGGGGGGGGSAGAALDAGSPPVATNDAGTASSTDAGTHDAASVATDAGAHDAGASDAGGASMDSGVPVVGSCTMIVPGAYNDVVMATKGPGVDPNDPWQVMLCASYTYTRGYPSDDMPAGSLCTVTAMSDDGCSVTMDCTFTGNGLHYHTITTRTVAADGKQVVTDTDMQCTDNNFVHVVDCAFHAVATKKP